MGGVQSINLEYVFNQILEFFQGFPSSSGSFTYYLHFILSILSVFFIIMLVYCFVRLLEIRKKEHEHLHHEIIEYSHHLAEKEQKIAATKGVSHNKQWGVVLQYLFSVNPGDWKLAIIEADNMLDDLMDSLGIKGENLGEKLKNADKDKFRNINFAWEVHVVRNRIAHEGANFELSQHEAKRLIALYEQVFREFGFI